MYILVLGGTRYFGIHLVNDLLAMGHNVTIATRGQTPDTFGDQVTRIHVDRNDLKAMKQAFQGSTYDIVYDNIAYCSNDVKNILNFVHCNRYILTSTVSVYKENDMNMRECYFDSDKYRLLMGNRDDFDYGEGKRQAESVLTQVYAFQKAAIVRFPFVFGEDDYTKRLYYYVEHIVQGKPMYIDNLDAEFPLISSKDAGGFLAFLSNKRLNEVIQTASPETLTLQEVIDYVETKTGKKAILTECDDKAPLNGFTSFSINCDKAKKKGYKCQSLKQWLYPLLDTYIEEAKK